MSWYKFKAIEKEISNSLMRRIFDDLDKNEFAYYNTNRNLMFLATSYWMLKDSGESFSSLPIGDEF